MIFFNHFFANYTKLHKITQNYTKLHKITQNYTKLQAYNKHKKQYLILKHSN